MVVSDSPLKNVGGRPRRTDWQEPYLDRIRLYGTKFISAREVGVPWSVVWEECDRSPEFAEDLRTALQEFADRCEEVLLGQGMGLKGNPLPVFALLKKHRPSEYVEKAMTFNVDVQLEVPSDQARSVLAEMLAHVAPATVERLMPQADHIASGIQPRPRPAKEATLGAGQPLALPAGELASGPQIPPPGLLPVVIEAERGHS